MLIKVRCACAVERQIDTDTAGAWRLRCKTCREILFDPQTGQVGQAPPEPQAPARGGRAPAWMPPAPPAEGPSGQGRSPAAPPPLAPPLPPFRKHETTDDEQSQFNDWLQGSAELKVLMSSDGDPASVPHCKAHPKYKVVAACSRCDKLLCKRCLDRVGDAFTCSDCVANEVLKTKQKAKGGGGLVGFFKKLFGGGSAKAR